MSKKILIWCGAMITITILYPAFIVGVGGFYNPVLLEEIRNEKIGDVPYSDVERSREEEVIQILAGTLSANSHIEAIKAQAVMIRTYMLRRELGIVEEEELARMSIEQMKSYWGSSYEEIYGIYESAAYDTLGEVIYYDNELIEPIYHQESTGYTRDAEAVYGTEIPYLKAVESKGDDYKMEKVILKTEMVSKLQEAYPDMIIDGNYIENQIQVIERDQSGYIVSMQIGNKMLSGEAFRYLFNLSSSAMSFFNEKSTIIIETTGNGHGVGLSLEGANTLAGEGYSYEAILAHYYNGIEIEKQNY